MGESNPQPVALTVTRLCSCAMTDLIPIIIALETYIPTALKQYYYSENIVIFNICNIFSKTPTYSSHAVTQKVSKHGTRPFALLSTF